MVNQGIVVILDSASWLEKRNQAILMGKKQQKTDNKSEEVRNRIDDIKKNTSDLERKKQKFGLGWHGLSGLWRRTDANLLRTLTDFECYFCIYLQIK